MVFSIMAFRISTPSLLQISPLLCSKGSLCLTLPGLSFFPLSLKSIYLQFQIKLTSFSFCTTGLLFHQLISSWGGKVLFYSPERRKPLGYEMSIGQMFVGLCRSPCTGSCIRGCPDTFNVLQTYRFTVTGTVHCDLAQFPSTIQHSLCGGVCMCGCQS